MYSANTILTFAVAACEVIGWFAILFTGRFPRGLRDFVVGFLRWHARVYSYVISLRDEFPPFSLAHDAGAGSTRAKALSGFAGIAIIALAVAAGVSLFLALSRSESAAISYPGLTQGNDTAQVTVSDLSVTLQDAQDPYDFPDELITPGDGNRFVEFELTVLNDRATDVEVESDDFRLKDDGGHSHKPAFLSLDGAVPPKKLKDGLRGDVTVIFEIAQGSDPTELKYSPPSAFKDAEFDFQ